MHDARVVIADTLVLSPRKTELSATLVLWFKPRSEDAHAMEAWFASARTPGDDFKREVKVEFGKRRRVRLADAYPSIRRTVTDQIGRERVEYVVRYSDREDVD